MRTGGTVVSGLAVVLLVVGCSGTPGASSSSAPPVNSSSSTASQSLTPTVTPTPRPTVMDKQMARTTYLAAVCPSNAVSDQLTALVAGKTPGQLKVAKVRATATSLVKAFKSGYLTLTEPEVPWPSNITKDIAVIADDFLSEIDSAQQMADARTAGRIIYAWDKWPAQPAAERKAVQRVRLLLGLPTASAGKSGCP